MLSSIAYLQWNCRISKSSESLIVTDERNIRWASFFFSSKHNNCAYQGQLCRKMRINTSRDGGASRQPEQAHCRISLNPEHQFVVQNSVAAFLEVFQGFGFGNKTCSASFFWIINCFGTEISLKRFRPWNHIYLTGCRNVSFARRVLCYLESVVVSFTRLYNRTGLVASGGRWGNTRPCGRSVCCMAADDSCCAGKGDRIDQTRAHPHKVRRHFYHLRLQGMVNRSPDGLERGSEEPLSVHESGDLADSIKHKWLQDSDTPPADRAVEVNIGFADTESHGYWHFIDTGFTSDHSTVPATPAPNVATQIAALRLAIASGEDDILEAYDLVWLEHLVGDIHQPLHGSARYFSEKSDIGGNLVKIRLTSAMKKKFEGTQSKTAPRELHAFWDDLPGEGQPAAALTDAVTFASGLSAAADAQVADTDSDDWAAESLYIGKERCLSCSDRKRLAAGGFNQLFFGLFDLDHVLRHGDAGRESSHRTRWSSAGKTSE